VATAGHRRPGNVDGAGLDATSTPQTVYGADRAARVRGIAHRLMFGGLRGWRGSNLTPWPPLLCRVTKERRSGRTGCGSPLGSMRPYGSPFRAPCGQYGEGGWGVRAVRRLPQRGAEEARCRAGKNGWAETDRIRHRADRQPGDTVSAGGAVDRVEQPWCIIFRHADDKRAFSERIRFGHDIPCNNLAR